MRVGGYEGKPLKLPQYCLDRYILIEIRRQIAEVDKNCKTRKGYGYVFPIDLGHYKCRSIQYALGMQAKLKTMNLPTYFIHSQFDSKGFAQSRFDLHPTFIHKPQIEDFWVYCEEDYEVRKKWWSRLALK